MAIQDQRVLVTGASAGIGAATAEAFAAAGASELLLNGRRRERLEALAKRLAGEHGVAATVLPFDIRDRAALERLAEETPAVFDVDVLVNNAGLARGTDPLHAGDPADWEEMLETNVLGLLYLTRKIAPGMVERGRGHIVNLGSTAGRWVYPGGAVYNATKFAVRALTEGLRMDLHGSGVRVTNIAPGLVETEFSVVRFKGDEARAAKVYEGAEVLTAGDIADAIVWCCTRPQRVNVQEMVIFPTDQAAVAMVHRRAH